MSIAVQTGQVSTSVARRIGPSDLTVFPIAMSGNVFGWTADVDSTTAVLDTFVGQGGNFIDTADSYAAGRSEIMIGNWMRDRGNRDSIVIATKIGKSADNPGLAPAAIFASVDASLRRLHSGHIDLLYLHIDDESVPFDETLMAVDSLIASGKVRYFGGSDHTGNRVIEARIASAQLGVAHMVALQNQYHLLFRREFETGLARVAEMQNLGVMPRFALASGFLTGKYRSRADLRANPRGGEAAKYFTKKGIRVLGVLDRIAADLACSAATVALAWLLSKPGVVAPVVSARVPEQVAALTAAARVQLTRQQCTELDRVSA